MASHCYVRRIALLHTTESECDFLDFDEGVRLVDAAEWTARAKKSTTKSETVRRFSIEPLAPDDIREEAKRYDPDKLFVIKRAWTWHPLGNEELILGADVPRDRHKRDAP